MAISTPPGRGGIGIVRLSGSRAVSIASPMLRLRSPLAHAHARFAEILEDGERLDEAVVTLFAAPNSYTTEDIVEIAAHGSPVILDHVVRQCLAGGARLAEPGEFTQRAFLAGRIDLTQAEAVRDLIDAQTLHQARVAAQQMGGALARRIQPAKQSLVNLIATLEAGIDFAEDDIDVISDAEILARIAVVRAPLEALAASFAYGRIVHSGLTLAIVGRPNAGKSSLFNRLVERERAIVTATPGTTRDLVTESVSIGGIPVHLIDTAGFREATSEPLAEAETLGMEKSREAMAEADLVLLVLDATQPLNEGEASLLESLRERAAIVVRNKCDLVEDDVEDDVVDDAVLDVVDDAADNDVDDAVLDVVDHVEDDVVDDAVLDVEVGVEDDVEADAEWAPPVSTSALTGAGIAELRERILATVQQGSGGAESCMLTNLRQQQAIEGALAALAQAADAVASQTPHEMLLLDIYAALRALDSLTGATTPDDILNLIFSTFCIGK